MNEPYGQLGKAFLFTREDLEENRVGYMTLPQQFQFKFWERKAYNWLLKYPPFKWAKARKVVKVSGQIKKIHHIQVVSTWSGGRGSGGHQNTVETRHFNFLTLEGDVISFSVNEKQYNALPENIEMTLYYEPQENRIVSVEPPYAQK